MNVAVFFDRDGVLNEAVVQNGVPRPPRSLAELRVIRGAEAAVQRVRDAGFKAIAITNQPDVARGSQRADVVESINAALTRRLGLDAVYTCMHDDCDECSCRKPKPGLLIRAARDYDLHLASSYVVGDREKDVLCGKVAGCKTIFIDYGYGETKADPGADFSVHSLEEAIRCVMP